MIVKTEIAPTHNESLFPSSTFDELPSALITVVKTISGIRICAGKPPIPAPTERHIERDERSTSSSVMALANEP